MQEEIKELSLAIAGIDQQLLIEELKDLKAKLSLELQASRDDRKAREKEFREFMAYLWATLDRIQARFRIDGTLLQIIKPEKAGEKKWQEKSSSSRSRMLDGFAKSGS